MLVTIQVSSVVETDGIAYLKFFCASRLVHVPMVSAMTKSADSQFLILIVFSLLLGWNGGFWNDA